MGIKNRQRWSKDIMQGLYAVANNIGYLASAITDSQGVALKRNPTAVQQQLMGELGLTAPQAARAIQIAKGE